MVRETVPDWVLKRVDEIVLSDVTPEALQTRMRRGDIYPMERVDRALGNFFRPSNLIALREIALRHVAQVVDRSLEPYIETETDPAASLQVGERIAVGISSNPAAQYLVARASRMAQAVNGELFVVYVDIGADDDDPERQRSLQANFQFAENLGAQVVQAEGQGGRARHGGVRSRKAHHPGDLRTLRYQRLAPLSVFLGGASLPARRSGGGCSHREAASVKTVSSFKFQVSSKRVKKLHASGFELTAV